MDGGGDQCYGWEGGFGQSKNLRRCSGNRFLLNNLIKNVCFSRVKWFLFFASETVRDVTKTNKVSYRTYEYNNP